MRPHQDSTFLRTDPPSVLGLWWALEDSTKQNGCLWALPGIHKEGVARHFMRKWALSALLLNFAIVVSRQAVCAILCSTLNPEIFSLSMNCASHWDIRAFGFRLRGVHKWSEECSFMCREDDTVTFDNDLPQYPREDFVPIEVPSGALVLLHGANVHFSHSNASPHSRHAYSMHVIEGAPGTHYLQDNW